MNTNDLASFLYKCAQKSCPIWDFCCEIQEKRCNAAEGLSDPAFFKNERRTGAKNFLNLVEKKTLTMCMQRNAIQHTHRSQVRYEDHSIQCEKLFGLLKIRPQALNE